MIGGRLLNTTRSRWLDIPEALPAIGIFCLGRFIGNAIPCYSYKFIILITTRQRLSERSYRIREVLLFTPTVLILNSLCSIKKHETPIIAGGVCQNILTNGYCSNSPISLILKRTPFKHDQPETNSFCHTISIYLIFFDCK